MKFLYVLIFVSSYLVVMVFAMNQMNAIPNLSPDDIIKLSKASKKPVNIKQLTNDLIFDKSCLDKDSCVLFILPNLDHCPAKCRKRNLALFQKAAQKFAQNRYGWLWSEAGQQPELEKMTEITDFAIPKVVMINANKMTFFKHKGGLVPQKIVDFIQGAQHRHPINKAVLAHMIKTNLPKILEVEEYVEVEDPYDFLHDEL